MDVKRKRMYGLLMVAAMALLAACGTNPPDRTSESGANQPQASQAANKPEEKTVVNAALLGGISPMLILKEKGWLEEEFAKLNAEVVWNEFASGPAVFEAMQSNRADISFAGDGAVLVAQAANVDFKAVSLISTGHKLTGIIVPKDSPIESVADLKGKQIALPKGTTLHVFLIKTLQKYGLTEDDVRIVNLLASDAQPAFETGRVDAWVTIDTSIIPQIAMNGAVLLTSGEAEGIASPVFNVVRGAFAAEHPELVAAYLKAYQRATDWQNASPEEAIDLYASAKNIDKAFVEQILAFKDALNEPITEDYIGFQQESANIMFANGFIRNEIDVAEAVDNSYLQQAGN